MTNVIVAKQRVIQVTSNTLGGILTTNQPVTLRNTPMIVGSGSGATTLTQLSDVGVINAANGATLVFNNATGVFEVQPLDISDVTGNLDGGTF